MINTILRKTAQLLYLGIPIILGIYSFLHMRSWDIPYTLAVLEALFFTISLVLSLTSISRSQCLLFPYTIVIFVYIIGSLIYATQIHSHYILDFFLIYKSFIYLFFLTLIVGKIVLNKNNIKIFINIIFILFLLKYSLSHLFNFIHRPFIYTENNFEIMFIATLYLYVSLNYKEKKGIYLLLFGIITFLSFSRSGIGIFVFVALMSYINKISIKLVIGALFMSPILIFLMYFIFVSRGDGIENLDRLNFLRVFFNETSHWTAMEYFLGSPRITQLDYSSCQELSFYEVLFSKSGNGDCYSVIFHSFILRVIFDHGILGFIFILYVTFKLLTLSNIPKKTTYIFIGIFVLNGLSVSSFNSVFFPLSMILLTNSELDDEKSIDNNSLNGRGRS